MKQNNDKTGLKFKLNKNTKKLMIKDYECNIKATDIKKRESLYLVSMVIEFVNRALARRYIFSEEEAGKTVLVLFNCLI